MLKKRVSKEIIKIVRGYSRRLAEQDKIPIEKVIIFGSYVKGSPRKWSDIDVCIISPKFKNAFKALQFLWTRRNKQEVMSGLEPVGFSRKDFEEGSSLIQEIKKTGIAIKP